MKKLLAVLLFALPVLVFAGGQQEKGSEDKTQETEKKADTKEPVEFSLINGGEPESLDPHLIQGVPEHRIYESLFEGLFAYDPETAEAVPGLAKEWTVNDDKTVYTFTLRKTTWSDGVAITAQTVVDSWLRVLNPETAGPYAWFPSMFIKGAAEYNSGEAGSEAVKIEAVDDYTFKMELVGPLPYVLGALPHYSFAVVPMHAIEKYGDKWTLPKNFVGNGPYTLEEWKPQEKLTVVPNDSYWDKDKVKLDRVIYYPVDDNNTGYNMFLNGEVDWMTEVPLDQIEAALVRDDCHVNPQLATYYYTFQTQKAPFDNAKVRKALALAVDKQTLVDRVSRAGQIPAYGIVPPMTGYPGLEGKLMDVDKAKALLAEAGYPNGEGFPEVEILYNTSEGHKKIAEYIQQQWETNLGVTVSLVNQEWKTYLKTRNQGNFFVARAGWVGDYQDPNTFLDMFVTGGGMNGGKFSSAEYDELIKKAATMEPGKERFETLKKAEAILVTEEQAVMPIYYYVTKNMIDTSKWGGWHTNVMDYHPTKDIFKK